MKITDKKQNLAEFIAKEKAIESKELSDKAMKEIKGGAADNRREFDHIGQFSKP